MTETRPTGEQLRFVSSSTGSHILDTYLEAAERGGRTLPDLLADIFDDTTGLFRADIFEFRISSTRQLEVRIGDFADSTSGWQPLSANSYLFRARGAWAQSTAYTATDIVTYNNSTYFCSTPHTSASTFNAANWAIMLDGAALNTATSSAQTSATAAASSATSASGSATTATTKASEAAASAAAASTSASNASTSATNAATSATSASNSATSAASSATTATTQASAASTSATAAASSASSASSSASTATTQATNASNSATSAASSATTATTKASEAAASATSASTSATTATTKASEAATSATNAAASASTASTQASNASSSATDAAASAAAAAASYDSFDDRYLGSKTANPTVDNDGNALLTGALYFNTTLNEMRVYSGSSWTSISSGGGGAGASLFDDLLDVTLTSSATGDLIRYNGTAWVNYPGSNYAAASHTHTISDITSLQAALDAKQALDADLTAIAALSGASGILTKTAANTWSLDTATYSLSGHTHDDRYYTETEINTTLGSYLTTASASSTYLTQSSAASTYLTQSNAAGTYLTTASAASSYQPLDGDLTAIGAITGTSGLLKKTAANTWTLDTTSYANATHTHAISDVTSLQTTLDNKASVAHTHAISDITSLQTSLDAKAPLASPTLTGTPAAPTASDGTSTTQIATTAFAQTANKRELETALTSGSPYILLASDAGKMVTVTSSTAYQITVNANVFTAGDRVDISQWGAGQVSFSAGSGMSIRSTGSKLKLTGQYSGAALWFKSATECVLVGDITL